MQIATPHGRTVKLFSEFGMLAKLGVNSAAGLHFNILHHASDNDSAGVPVHAIARRLLEDATTVQEAIDIARTARVSASTVLTVFTRHDANPRAASIELARRAWAWWCRVRTAGCCIRTTFSIAR